MFVKIIAISFLISCLAGVSGCAMRPTPSETEWKLALKSELTTPIPLLPMFLMPAGKNAVCGDFLVPEKVGYILEVVPTAALTDFLESIRPSAKRWDVDALIRISKERLRGRETQILWNGSFVDAVDYSLRIDLKGSRALPLTHRQK
jgi:hypothetical protein